MRDVVSKDNSCRHCVAAHTGALKAIGVSEHDKQIVMAAGQGARAALAAFEYLVKRT